MDSQRKFSSQRDQETRNAWVRRILLATVIVLVIIFAYCAGHKLLSARDDFTIDQTRQVVSRVDGLSYRVHEGHSGSQTAADTLAELNKRVIDVMRYLRNRYMRGVDGELYPARRTAVSRLLSRYNPDNLAENSPKDPSGDTAYSLDKGAIVAICLRERTGPKAGNIHDIGILTFVTLHEMSHIAVEVVDHPPEFWSTFKFLLESAEDANIYRSPDFSKNPVTYCGVKVDYSPRWDSATQAI